MRKAFIIILLQSCFLESQGQSDSSNYEKLLADCRDIYLIETNTRSANFFGALLTATTHQLRMENPLFKSAHTELKSVWPGEREEMVYYKMADSIYTRIRNQHLWGGREISLLWLSSTLKIYADKYCSCLSEKTIENEKDYARYSAECDKQLANDFITINKIRTEMAKVPEKERNNILPLIPTYLYQECEKVREINNKILVREVRERLESYISFLQYDLREKFLVYYKNDRKDSAALLFPGYNNYKKGIDFILQFTSKENEALTISKTNENDSTAITITKTYYVNNKEIKLTGQVVCEIDGKNTFAPVIKSLQFISPEKIMNKKELLEKIDAFENIELPPPPILELRKEIPEKQ